MPLRADIAGKYLKWLQPMFDSFSISHAEARIKANSWRSLKIILMISFLPLVLGFIIGVENGEFYSTFMSVFLSGELYFYAMSLCGSLYVTSQLSNHESNLGMRLWSGVFVICCCAFMAYYISQSSLSDSFNPAFHGFLSVGFLLFAVFLSFRIMVLSEQPPPMPEQVNRERADDMIENVEPEYD